MSKRKKLIATSEQVNNAFGVLERALRSTGRLLPENENDVHLSEMSTGIERVSLPNLLQDPFMTLARGREVLKDGLSGGLTHTDTVSGEIKQNLKQAARNGRLIPDEIQARMRKDRNLVTTTKKTK